MVFKEKCFSCYTLIDQIVQLTKLILRLSLFLEILGNKCIAIVCFPGCDAKNFEINLMVLIELSKRAFKIDEIISSFLKDFKFPKVVSDMRGCL